MISIRELGLILQNNNVSFGDCELIRPETAEIPVIKIIFQEEPLLKWQQLRALSSQTGLWPLEMYEPYIPDLIEEDLLQVNKRLRGVDEVVLPNLLKDSLVSLNPLMLRKSKRPEEFDLVCEPAWILENGTPYHVDPTSVKKNEQRIHDLFLIPAENSWTALAYCQTEVWLDADVTSIAWARRWAEKYDAHLFSNDGSSHRFYVGRPPRTPLACLELMNEHFHSGFGGEYAGTSFVSGQAYGAHLAGNSWWYFWWD